VVCPGIYASDVFTLTYDFGIKELREKKMGLSGTLLTDESVTINGEYHSHETSSRDVERELEQD
jgi:hypothetical protein